jgi:hypothetical protein
LKIEMNPLLGGVGVGFDKAVEALKALEALF